jgi:hypothetical protein
MAMQADTTDYPKKKIIKIQDGSSSDCVCVVYVCGLCLQQGKQIVMHAIRPKDKPQVVTPGKGDRVMMSLLNTIYTTKKNEETGLPEPVVKYEVRLDATGRQWPALFCWHPTNHHTLGTTTI